MLHPLSLRAKRSNPHGGDIHAEGAGKSQGAQRINSFKKLCVTLRHFAFQINIVWIAASPMPPRNDGVDVCA